MRCPPLLDCPVKSNRPGHFCCSLMETGRKNLFPDLTPVRLTFALALELPTDCSHTSAALRANAIQNAGHHIGIRLGCTPSRQLHTPSIQQRLSTIGDRRFTRGEHIKQRSPSTVKFADPELLNALPVPIARSECDVRRNSIVVRVDATKLCAAASIEQVECVKSSRPRSPALPATFTFSSTRRRLMLLVWLKVFGGANPIVCYYKNNVSTVASRNALINTHRHRT